MHKLSLRGVLGRAVVDVVKRHRGADEALECLDDGLVLAGVGADAHGCESGVELNAVVGLQDVEERVEALHARRDVAGLPHANGRRRRGQVVHRFGVVACGIVLHLLHPLGGADNEGRARCREARGRPRGRGGNGRRAATRCGGIRHHVGRVSRACFGGTGGEARTLSFYKVKIHFYKATA